MTIKRNVNGTEMSFELDPREMIEAYVEQAHNFDREKAETMGADIAPEQAEAIADVARSILVNNDTIRDAIREAFLTAYEVVMSK